MGRKNNGQNGIDGWHTIGQRCVNKLTRLTVRSEYLMGSILRFKGADGVDAWC